MTLQGPKGSADTKSANAGGPKPPSKFESLLDQIDMGGRVNELEQQVAKHEQNKRKHEQDKKALEKKQKALEEEIVQLKRDKQDMAKALKTANGKINNQELLIKSLRKEIDRLEDQQQNYMQGLIEPLTPIHHTDDPVPQPNTSVQKPTGSDPVDKQEAVPKKPGITIDQRFTIQNDACRICSGEGRPADHAQANCRYMTSRKRKDHRRAMSHKARLEEELEQKILADIGREMEEGPGALEMERILRGGKNVAGGVETQEASGEPPAKKPRTT